LPIRAATAADIPTMMDLERDAALAAHWSRAQYETIVGESALRVSLVIEEESQVQGFLIARRIDREWELENVVVSPGRRRHGLGARLLRALLDFARSQGAAAVFLEVRESNTAARALYEKCGFIHKGNRPGYYHDPKEGAALYHFIFL
jgi:ribosomal-protein-alanine N-acetyltransferase